MSERLDAEDVKEITSRIFGAIAKIVGKYDGFIEKYVGDAIMALFGVPSAHDDDPIRAIRAAREIHELVDSISPEIEARIGRPIAMHTGINTGLVVTGEVDVERGTHGVAGDTLNLAARLSSVAREGEILVGLNTYRQAEGHFTFEVLEPKTLKGKAEPVHMYKVLAHKERPVTLHRLSGLKAELIGRKAEMTQLGEAVENLRKGTGRILSICGDAGTGKSRLVEEFKATLNLEEIQWLEGHAYAYSQNIPYFPLIDFFSRVLKIEEGDPQPRIREKVENGVATLVAGKEHLVPYIGSLYTLRYPEVEEVSPEFWKRQLQEAVQTILAALALRAPTIFCLEDLHWADPSFVELLRHCLCEIRRPAMVLCVYRPEFRLFTRQQVSGIGHLHQEIRLKDLSASEAQEMLESLLQAESIPSALRRFIQDKAEGNPFYLEELVNALIDSDTLVRDNGHWKLTRPLREAEISSTIHGVITGRLDRLAHDMKRLLQEASVIGRVFLYELLKKIAQRPQDLDRGLRDLEQLDLIRTRSLQPELEYEFKHALTQEVVYSGLLKKERRDIHERIALVMEQMFHDRLPEFYETLAFHCKQGKSLPKAVDYLMKSGEKSLKRYAVEEAHQYYHEAFELLATRSDTSRDAERLLIDLLMKWALVFYYRGDFTWLTELFRSHMELAESLADKARLGMFYAWLGFAWYCNGKMKDSYQYLCMALKIGEELDNREVIGYACCWLSWTCADLGLLDDAIVFANRAQEISRGLDTDQYLYFKSLGGLGYAYYHRGERQKALAAGQANVDYGQRHSNIRSMGMGLWVMGFSHILNGDSPSAVDCCHRAMSLTLDPLYDTGAKLVLGFAHVSSGHFQEAEESLKEVVTFTQNFGCGILGTIASVLLGVVSIAKGHMSQGLNMLQDAQRTCLEQERKCVYAQSEYTLGKVYFQMVQGEAQVSLATMVKNLGFLVKNLPFARKKAEAHFKKAIGIAEEIGAKGTLGMASLDLGLLYRATGKKDKSRACLSKARQCFEQCEIEISPPDTQQEEER
jgi:class 3 adenylate cyclase/tetratricopeptide (TPR) repeat protein